MVAFPSYRTLNFAFFIVSSLVLLAQCSPEQRERVYLKHQLRALNSPHLHKRQNTSTFELAQARKVLNEAVAQQSQYNRYRLQNPRRNTYVSRHSNEAKAFKSKRDNEPSPPILNTTVLAAARLVAEFNAAAQFANGTLHNSYAQPQFVKGLIDAANLTKRATGAPYWVPNVAQTGHAPMGNDNSYMVSPKIRNIIHLRLN